MQRGAGITTLTIDWDRPLGIGRIDQDGVSVISFDVHGLEHNASGRITEGGVWEQEPDKLVVAWANGITEPELPVTSKRDTARGSSDGARVIVNCYREQFKGNGKAGVGVTS